MIHANEQRVEKLIAMQLYGDEYGDYVDVINAQIDAMPEGDAVPAVAHV